MTDQELIEIVAVEVMRWRKDIPFYPLNDMNHAFMVVKKLRELEYEVRLTIYEMAYSCELIHNNLRKPIYVINPLSIGHSICLAALEAVRKPD